ncbi:Protein decapping 5 [Camellia lanceoleosa]|uniref:Protein decapping 5 n=1 Tax=Camellia lanceoleosa TaxID=1840588 RepID=A0ACC0FMN4_9ERIC|nr:Protein decapping 5 [Camellia lanceoleosa]
MPRIQYSHYHHQLPKRYGCCLSLCCSGDVYLSGTDAHTRNGEKDHARGKANWPNKPAVHTHRSDGVHGRGRGTQVSPTITKFTEDFDFDAMNAKFNKEEIWGHLRKSNKNRMEDEEGDENDKGK